MVRKGGPVGLGSPGGQDEGSKGVLSLSCMLESSGELLTSTDAWVPPPEILIQLVWGAAWVWGESHTPQEISTRSQDSGHCKEALPVAGGWAGGQGDRGQMWGHGPKHHHTPLSPLRSRLCVYGFDVAWSSPQDWLLGIQYGDPVRQAHRWLWIRSNSAS